MDASRSVVAMAAAAAATVWALNGCAGTPPRPPPAPNAAAVPAAAETAGWGQQPVGELPRFPGTYPRRLKDGTIVYCWQDHKPASRLPRESCASEEEMNRKQEQSQAARQTLEDMRDSRTGALPGG